MVLSRSRGGPICAGNRIHISWQGPGRTHACARPRENRLACVRQSIYTPPPRCPLLYRGARPSPTSLCTSTAYFLSTMASPPRRSETRSESPRPSSPSPAKSVRMRMTSAMRRASTGLAFGTKIPTLSRSSSKNSLKVDPAQAPTTSDDHVTPSPVVETAEESPSAPTQLGPSPLQNSTSPPESAATEPVGPTESVIEPVTAQVVASAPLAETREEQLTRSPEQAPAELPIPAPTAAPEPKPFGFSDPILPTTEPLAAAASPVIVPSDAHAPAEAPTAAMPEPTPAVPLPPPAEPVARPPVEDRRADYFSFGDPVVPAVSQSKEEESHPAEPIASVALPAQTIPAQEPTHYEDVSHVQIPTDESTFAWSDEPALGRKRSRSSVSEPAQHALETSQPSGLESGKVSTRASKSSLASSYGNVVSNSAEHKRGRSSSVRFIDPLEDPFADPPEATKTGLSPIESVNIPECVLDGGLYTRVSACKTRRRLSRSLFQLCRMS
ncbi:hypothetical protein BV20DRAFT_177599 [Pilatotrama ljubarskyi]|nr:hypothetical protein BV20DRAFT_177599 [Pilatotrama ljubarskyi]